MLNSNAFKLLFYETILHFRSRQTKCSLIIASIVIISQMYHHMVIRQVKTLVQLRTRTAANKTCDPIQLAYYLTLVLEET